MARVTLGTDTSGRPLVIDDRTLAKLRLAEKRLGHTFVIVQGSWRAGSGAAASAGTHDRGGVIDLRTWDLGSITPAKAVYELRRAGLIAWYRHQGQGFDPHIHAVDYGNPDLHPSAAHQVAEWKAGRNGLASRGPDDGPRIPIPADPPEEPTMKLRDVFRYKLRKDGTTFADVLRTIERDVRAIRQDVAAIREAQGKDAPPAPKA